MENPILQALKEMNVNLAVHNEETGNWMQWDWCMEAQADRWFIHSKYGEPILITSDDAEAINKLLEKE